MQIQTIAQVIVNAGIEAVFDASTDCQNLPKFFTGYKGIPAIVSAKTIDGLPLHEGSIRIVTNSDGSSIEEVIVSLARPDTQRYELVKGFKPPFSWLIRAASGKWSYETLDAKTRVVWNFYFELSNLFAYLVFRLVVQRPFQQAQELCLRNLKQYVEDRGDSTQANNPNGADL
ncbi:SRPBCC family protein [Leptolyngbya sp. FACHB-321]|uniref:SRPBCC family protein n=1 Tax=Leptolyngbya sp. FACHB-321 TaxID=2692807 RepID=UPI0016841F44|nr:SRPBCC family protein [Leptolyngbya sp. FACHB-321]MBD2033598.1 SRPBCC family protein [Leptolyngbya sp. FACHB-321]